jgi:hypothetical protein
MMFICVFVHSYFIKNSLSWYWPLTPSFLTPFFWDKGDNCIVQPNNIRITFSKIFDWCHKIILHGLYFHATRPWTMTTMVNRSMLIPTVSRKRKTSPIRSLLFCPFHVPRSKDKTCQAGHQREGSVSQITSAAVVFYRLQATHPHIS